MELRTLKVGSNGELVEALQHFLTGSHLYTGVVDGVFGPRTREAVQGFQDRAGLNPDGIVGNRTWGALMAAGLTLLESDTDAEDRSGPNWPAAPASLRALTAAERARRFGAFTFQPEPTQGNPEGIRITSRPPEFKIISVECPLLVAKDGFPRTGIAMFHESAADPFRALVKAWTEAGLLQKIRTWGGSYVPRFVRGSRSVLSPHAWGTAFDINVAWNPLGAEPALAGRQGSVRELVQIANECGWWWGGHWKKRPDGMHFELGDPAR